jgi:hypothetical protein
VAGGDGDLIGLSPGKTGGRSSSRSTVDRPHSRKKRTLFSRYERRKLDAAYYIDMEKGGAISQALFKTNWALKLTSASVFQSKMPMRPTQNERVCR